MQNQHAAHSPGSYSRNGASQLGQCENLEPCSERRLEFEKSHAAVVIVAEVPEQGSEESDPAGPVSVIWNFCNEGQGIVKLVTEQRDFSAHFPADFFAIDFFEFFIV